MLCRQRQWHRNCGRPGAGGFAVLFGLESLDRSLIAAVLPIQTLRLMGSDEGHIPKVLIIDP